MTPIKALALNVIVGANESQELDRLLTSLCQPGIFDEVVVVRTSHDPAVEAVAKKWATCSPYFAWCDDFGKARNCALDNTTAAYVMWADADDVCPPESQKRLAKMKDHVLRAGLDVYLMPYHLAFNASGAMTDFVMRERVFRRRSSLRWVNAIHERVSVNRKIHGDPVRIMGICLEHRPIKDSRLGLERNVRILKRACVANPKDPDMAFYLARDSFLLGRKREAIRTFDRLLVERVGSPDNMVQAALQLAHYYTYKDETQLRRTALDKGENYARVALSFSEKYAEPYVVLGDIYHFRGRVEDAERLFKIAMGKKLDSNGPQDVLYYEAIPADRLAHIAIDAGEWEKAMYYNWLALKAIKDDERLPNRVKFLWAQLQAKYRNLGCI